jgi:hypothetical protein
MRQVILTARQYRDIIRDTWAAVKECNIPPKIFLRGEIPVRIVVGETGPKIDILNSDKMFGVIINCANFTAMNAKGYPVPTKPTQEIAKTMVVLPDVDIPPIDGVSSTPLFAPSGQFCTENGYNKELRTYFYGMESLRVDVTSNSVADALAVIREVFCDFPFQEIEFAHILSMLLCPFVRKIIQGTTPIHLIEANSPGGGKTLMASTIHLIATGEKLAPIAPSDKEEEMRKRITSLLVEGKGIIVLDNLNRELNSGVLASAITSERWSDRPMGLTKIVDIPNKATWIVTGNNPRLSLEVARRCIRIRLTAEGDKPWARTTEEYKHPDLGEWVTANRAKILGAVKVLVDNWFSKGQPKPPPSWTLGSFESWSSVVGGILYAAGVDGFLKTNEEMYSAADVETTEWEAFVTAWWTSLGNKWCSPQELAILAEKGDFIPSVLGDGMERGRRIRVGYALVKRRDTWIGEFKIEQRKDSVAKTVHYRLVRKQCERDNLTQSSLPTLKL